MEKRQREEQADLKKAGIEWKTRFFEKKGEEWIYKNSLDKRDVIWFFNVNSNLYISVYY